MRVKTTATTVYDFNELSEEAKENATNNLADINVDYEWWDSIYVDADMIGVKITEFDIDRASYCKGDFLASAEETAHKIETEHGENCETFKDAKKYLTERDEIVNAATRDEDGEIEDEYKFDQQLDELDAEFLKTILEDCLSLLRQDYEYATSEKAIIETIECNEYEFTEDGKLA